VPEVVIDGENGFLVGDVEEMIAAIGRLDEISPETCRADVERRFSPQVMTDSYIRVYEQVAAARA